MTDRPDARELVEAVAQWLAQDLAPALDKGTRFQALVAAQALAIAARELVHGEAFAAEDHVAFTRLIGEAPDARRTLADALRAGRLDDRLAEVADVLREHVRRKLVLARPGYDAPPL